MEETCAEGSLPQGPAESPFPSDKTRHINLIVDPNAISIVSVPTPVMKKGSFPPRPAGH